MAISTTSIAIYLATVLVLAVIEKLILNYEDEYRAVAVYFVPLFVIILLSSLTLVFYQVQTVVFWMALLTGFPIGIVAQYITVKQRREISRQIEEQQENINSIIDQEL